MSLEEAYGFTRAGYIDMIHSTSSWLGTPSRAFNPEGSIMIARFMDNTNGNNSGYSAGGMSATAGVRPVIII